MLVDEYEQYQNNNDRTDVVVVSRSGSEEPETEPLANDRKGIHFPFHHLRHVSTHPPSLRTANPATDLSEWQ